MNIGSSAYTEFKNELSEKQDEINKFFNPEYDEFDFSQKSTYTGLIHTHFIKRGAAIK